MTLRVAQGRTIRLPAEFLAGEDATDPATPLVQILNPSNVPVVTDAVPECDGVGLYHYDFAVAGNAPLGSWTARWTATLNGEPVSGEDIFEVVPHGAADSAESPDQRTEVAPATAVPESSKGRTGVGRSRRLGVLGRRKDPEEASATASAPVLSYHEGGVPRPEVSMASVEEREGAATLEDPRAITVETREAEIAEAGDSTAEAEEAERAAPIERRRLTPRLGTSQRFRLGVLGLVLLSGLVAAVFMLRTSESEDPKLTLKAGVEAHLDGDLEKASVQYRKTLQLDPDNKLAHYNLGVIEQVSDRPERAERYYLRALSQDPNFVPALFNLAFIKGELGDNQAAIDLYRRVLSLNPNLAAAHLNVGAILRRVGQVEEGDAEIRRALELDPRLRTRVSEQARAQPAQ